MSYPVTTSGSASSYAAEDPKAPPEAPFSARRHMSMDSFDLDAGRRGAHANSYGGHGTGNWRRTSQASGGGGGGSGAAAGPTLRQQQFGSFATSRGFSRGSQQSSTASPRAMSPSYANSAYSARRAPGAPGPSNLSIPAHGSTSSTHTSGTYHHHHRQPMPMLPGHGPGAILRGRSANSGNGPSQRGHHSTTASVIGGGNIDDDDDDDDRQHEYAFPWPIQAVYQKLFLDLREDTDDFDTILRKIVVTVGVPLVVFPIAFAIYVSTEVAISGVTAGAITALIIMFVFPLVWIPAYVYVRQTRETPDTLMDAWLIVTILSVGFLSLSLVEYPNAILAFFLAAISIMCHTKLLWGELALGAVVYLLSAYNYAVVTGKTVNSKEDSVLLALPDPYRGTILERVAYQGTAFVIGLIIIAALLMQMREHVRQIQSASEAAAMSKKVATELQRYDTDAVQVTLTQYSKRGLADTYLIETFAAIVDNLLLFRPHLPNWMLLSLNGQLDDPDVMEHGGTGGDTDLSRTSSVSSMHSLRIDRCRNGSVVGELRTSDLQTNRTGSGFSLREQANLATGDKLQKQTRSFMKRPADRADPTTLVVSVGPRPYKGKVSYVILEVTTADDLGLRRFESIGSRFVDRVHQAAAETHAAVHTFVGDTVHASWNSATRVAICEVKACRFVANLLKDAGDAAVSVQGCVMTGEARAYLAGTKQTALTVSFKWRDALHAAVIQARKRHAVYLCPDTHHAARESIVSRGAEAIRVRRHPSDADYEVNDNLDATARSDIVDMMSNSADSGQAQTSLTPQQNGRAGALLASASPRPLSNGTADLNIGSPSRVLLSQGLKGGGLSSTVLSGGKAASKFKNSRVIPLYQLFKEREERELTQDEWLYVVDATTEKSNLLSDTALQKCLQGDFYGAITELADAVRLHKQRLRSEAAQFEGANLEEAQWVDDDDEEDDVDAGDDPVLRSMLKLKARAEECLRNRRTADDFPTDMSAFF